MDFYRERTTADALALNGEYAAALEVWSNLLANAALMNMEQQIECLVRMSALFHAEHNLERAESCIRLSIILKSKLYGPLSDEVLSDKRFLADTMKQEDENLATFGESQKYEAVAKVLSPALPVRPFQKTKENYAPFACDEHLDVDTNVFDERNTLISQDWLNPDTGRRLADSAIEKLFAA